MNGPRRSGPRPTGPAGSDRPWRPSLGWLALALVILAGALAFASMSSSKTPADGDTASRVTPLATYGSPLAVPGSPAAAAASHPVRAAPRRAATAGSAAATLATPQIPRTRDPDGDLTPDLSDYVNAGERPTMNEVIDRLHAAGVHGGLGAFQPPGTRPPLVGLAVPEDFPLPEGYVRHYQTTDEGQPIEPILMFAPDARLFDADNRPIAIPADRVVPPELAPPGLPIRRIVIPAPAEPGRPGR